MILDQSKTLVRDNHDITCTEGLSGKPARETLWIPSDLMVSISAFSRSATLP